MDPIDELLKSATCDELLRHIRAEYAAWWDVRRAELLATPMTGIQRHRLDPLQLAALKLDSAKSEALEMARKHIEIYRQYFQRSGNAGLVSEENLTALEERLIRSGAVHLRDPGFAELRGEYERAKDRLNDVIKTQVKPLRTIGAMIPLTTKTTPLGSSDGDLTPAELWEAYKAQFHPERIIIRDLCWAAGQHATEWKRWLGGKMKAGSAPDRAFRKILTSGKRPIEYRPAIRPSGWE